MKILFLQRSFLAVMLVLFFAGCAHIVDYYEANVEGELPVTTMGCYGPSSLATVGPMSGIYVRASAIDTPTKEIILYINVYAETGGRFSYSSNMVTLKTAEFIEPIKVKMADFTTGFPTSIVVSPTADIVITKHGYYNAKIKLPSSAKEFSLQLPDMLINSSKISLPRIHFKRTTKSYIGFCEA